MEKTIIDMLSIIKLKWLWISIAIVLVGFSVVIFIIWGLKTGIDFTGGSLINIEFTGQRPEKTALVLGLKDLNFGNISIQPFEEKGYLLRLKFLTQKEYEEFISVVQNIASTNNKVLENSFETIGPAIGKELTRKAWQAIVFVLIAVILYIAWSFRRVSKPIQSWKYGAIAIVTLFHDIAIPTGFFVVLGKFLNVEIDILFVTALLAIMGFSVNDTIVIFDRIRENLIKSRNKGFDEIVNISVNQSLMRSINTSFTLFVVLFAIYFFGDKSLSYFILTFIIGVFFGVYSSLFVASPLLVIWNDIAQRKHTMV